MASLEIKPQVSKLLAKAIAKARAGIKTEKKAKNLEKISQANAEFERAIIQVRSRADRKERIYSRIIARVKAEAERSVASTKAEALNETAKVRSEAEQLIAKEQAGTDEKEKYYIEITEALRSEYEDKLATESRKRARAESIAVYEVKARAKAQEQIKTFSDAIAKEKLRADKSVEMAGRVKASVKAAISNVEAATSAKEKMYEERISQIKAEALESIEQENARAQETIWNFRVESEEKSKVYAKGIAQVKYAAKNAISRVKSEAARKLSAESRARSRAEAIVAAQSKARVLAEEKGKLHGEIITRLKSESAREIARIKAEARKAIYKEKERADKSITMKARFKEEAKRAIGQIKSAATEKEKSYSETIAKIRTELGLKMVRIKVEANEAIAKEQIKIKEMDKQIAKLRSKRETAHNKTTLYPRPKTDGTMVKIEKFAEKIGDYTKTENLLKNPAVTSDVP